MFAIIFDFFNLKKHPEHLWLFFSVFPYFILLITFLLEECLRLKLNISKDIREYLFLTLAPINMIGIGMYITLLLKKYRSFFKASTFHKVMLYIFLVATFVSSVWLLWEQVSSFKCNKFLCEIFVLFPLGATLITTSLLLLYSLILFGRIKKSELNQPNPYL